MVDVAAPVKGDCADVLLKTELSYPLSYKLSSSLQCSTAGKLMATSANWCRQLMHSMKLSLEQQQMLAENEELD